MHSDVDLVPLALAARRLRVTNRWLREQADNGVIPALRADDRYLVSLAAVQAKLATLAKQSIPRPPKRATRASRVIHLAQHLGEKRNGSAS